MTESTEVLVPCDEGFEEGADFGFAVAEGDDGTIGGGLTRAILFEVKEGAAIVQLS